MPSFNTTATRARTLLVDATVAASLIDAALHALDQGLAGWPTSTPGAAPLDAGGNIECAHPDCSNTRPCMLHDTEPGPDTSTERLALSHDKAAEDLASLHEEMRKAMHHAARAAGIVNRWAHQGITTTGVKERLAAIDSEIWCRNCIRHGQKNVRDGDHAECKFCRSFKADFGLAPDRAIFDARDARYGRLDVGTIERLLDRDHDGWRKRRPKKKPAASPAQEAKA